MRVDDSLRGVMAGEGDPPHAYATVVVRNILQQPVNRVEAIRALVNISRSGLLWFVRCHPLEFTFGQETPADILIYKDVLFIHKGRTGSEGISVCIRPLRRNAIWRPREQDRICLRRVPRRIYGRE